VIYSQILQSTNKPIWLVGDVVIDFLHAYGFVQIMNFSTNASLLNPPSHSPTSMH